MQAYRSLLYQLFYTQLPMNLLHCVFYKVKSDFFQLSRSVQIAFLSAIGFALFVCWDQSHFWQTREDYGFGFIVPFFVGYVIFDRWPAMKSLLLGKSASVEYLNAPQTGFSPMVASLFFSFMCMGGLLFLLLGGSLRASTGPSHPGTVSLALGFAAYLLGLAYLVSQVDVQGRFIPVKARLHFTALFLFPALIWLISAPMLSIVETKIKVFLLGKVVSVVLIIFDVLGFPIEQQGNVLILPTGNVGVADACSGIRSLTACIFAGSFLAAVFLDRFWKKLSMVLLAMLLAFLTNILRSLFLTAWAYNNGSGSIDGAVHDIAGYAVLGITCLGLIALLPLFNLKVSKDSDFLEHDLD